MDFVRSHFGKMKLWPVEHFFENICHYFWVGLLLHQHQQTHPKVMTNMLKKVFNWSFQNPYFSTLVFCSKNCSDLLWEKTCSNDQDKLGGWRSLGDHSFTVNYGEDPCKNCKSEIQWFTVPCTNIYHTKYIQCRSVAGTINHCISGLQFFHCTWSNN